MTLHVSGKHVRNVGYHAADMLGAPVSRRALLLGAAAAVGAAVLSAGPALAAPRRRVTAPPAWLDGKIYSYGHSFTMGPAPLGSDLAAGPYPYATHPYAELIGSHYGVPVDYNGRSATRLLDVIRAITCPQFAGLNPNPRQWTPGTSNGGHAVLWENVHNDESSDIGGDARYQEAFRGALRLGIGVFGSRKVIYPSAADYRSPGWASASYPDRAPGGAVWYTGTFGDKMDFTVSGDTCHIATLACDGDFLTYGTMKIYVNDVLITTVTGSDSGYYHGTDKMAAYADSVDGTNRIWSNYGLRVVGMNTIAGTSGNKKLTIRKVDDTTNRIWISGVYLTSGTPAKVFVGQEPPRNPAATAHGTVVNFEANDDAYRALIEDVVGDYFYARVVDLAPGWDNSTMVATTADPGNNALGAGHPNIADPYNFHPNGLGMTRLSGAFTDAIDAY